MQVIWPDAAWEQASLSSLMIPATLKKQFRWAADYEFLSHIQLITIKYNLFNQLK